MAGTTYALLTNGSETVLIGSREWIDYNSRKFPGHEISTLPQNIFKIYLGWTIWENEKRVREMELGEPADIIKSGGLSGLNLPVVKKERGASTSGITQQLIKKYSKLRRRWKKLKSGFEYLYDKYYSRSGLDKGGSL